MLRSRDGDRRHRLGGGCRRGADHRRQCVADRRSGPPTARRDLSRRPVRGAPARHPARRRADRSRGKSFVQGVVDRAGERGPRTVVQRSPGRSDTERDRGAGPLVGSRVAGPRRVAGRFPPLPPPRGCFSGDDDASSGAGGASSGALLADAHVDQCAECADPDECETDRAGRLDRHGEERGDGPRELEPGLERGECASLVGLGRIAPARCSRSRDGRARRRS